MSIRYPESFYKSVGNYACYFLCLQKIAENYTGFDYDTETLIQICSAHYMVNGKQWLTFNWDNYDDPANFDVNDPESILNMLTGKKWAVSIEPSTYKPKKNELYIECWKNPRTGLKHFRLRDWDPLSNSVTVKEGKLDSYRVFRLMSW